ncbi:DUF5331 domain-containing protein [Calothrix rhizosoleniae]|uniref:DUF5331 domain-containing protein n=1 Tax=Calothrix rhizosoleniae TaxID=888997 RepID=UPI000B49901D|nr:DUF5331 domain-containing protein [Calothrix rhizosoleniae]
MAFFYSFTDSLKNKWLQFFQLNRDWIKLHMEVESVYTPDGGKRPSSYLILGVANALEPKLAQLMLPFSRLNADADILVEVLGLHFDPDVALGNYNSMQSSSMMSESADDDNSEYVMDEVRHEGVSNDTVAEMDTRFTTSETVMEDGMSAMSTDDSDTFQMSEEPQNGMSNFSEAGFEESQVGASNDAFGDISFDDLKDSQTVDSAAGELEEQIDDQMFDDIGASADDAFGDVMKDVWSEENASQNGEADNQDGEEMSTDAIDTTEMAEIFSHN